MGCRWSRQSDELACTVTSNSCLYATYNSGPKPQRTAYQQEHQTRDRNRVGRTFGGGNNCYNTIAVELRPYNDCAATALSFFNRLTSSNSESCLSKQVPARNPRRPPTLCKQLRLCHTLVARLPLASASHSCTISLHFCKASGCSTPVSCGFFCT